MITGDSMFLCIGFLSPRGPWKGAPQTLAMIGQEEIKQPNEYFVKSDTLQVTCSPEAMEQALYAFLDWSQQLHTICIYFIANTSLILMKYLYLLS